MAVKVVLSGSVVQGTQHPLKLTLLTSDEVPDLTGASVAIEVYRDDGTTETASDGWVWATTTFPSGAGTPLAGTLTPPASPGGFNVGGVKVGVRAVVTLSGQPPIEYQPGILYVTPRNPVG